MYSVKKLVNGKPLYFMCIDDLDNAVWSNDAIYAYQFSTLREARAIAKQYNAIAYAI